MTDTEPEWLTQREVARRLRVHMSTIRKMIDRGQIHGIKVGGQWRISRQSIDRLTAEEKADDSA